AVTRCRGQRWSGSTALGRCSACPTDCALGRSGAAALLRSRGWGSVGGGGDAELVADLREPRLRLGVHRRLLDFEHAALDGLALELGGAQCLGVAALDLVADLCESGDVLADRLR